MPSSINFAYMILARVDFPDPDKPVKNSVKPLFLRGGQTLRISFTTSGYVTHEGISSSCVIASSISVFEKEEGEWNVKKSCGTTELSPDQVADIFSNFPPIKTNRITLRASITTILDTKLSHVELSGQVHDSINIKQKNIYDGKLIDITRKKATGMGISEKDNITEDFGPLAIRTNDLIALFSFNDQLTFSFGSGEKGYCRVTGRNFKMAGVIGLCRYDELGTIEKPKGASHGRQVKKSRRSKSGSNKPIKKRSRRKKG